MGLVDNLCVQIQRSMDFFESQLRQAPVRQIVINLDTRLQAEVARLIEKTMDLKGGHFEPESMSGQGNSVQQASFTALGAVFESYIDDKKTLSTPRDNVSAEGSV